MGEKDKQKTNWGRKTITTSRQKWGKRKGQERRKRRRGGGGKRGGASREAMFLPLP